jgi:hypothetical protein
VFRLDEDGVEVGIRESQLEFDLLPVHKRGVPPIFRSRLPHDVIPTVRRGHALGSAKELSVEGEGAQPRIGGGRGRGWRLRRWRGGGGLGAHGGRRRGTFVADGVGGGGGEDAGGEQRRGRPTVI